MKRRPPIKLDKAEAEEMSRRAEELDDLFEDVKPAEEPEQSVERCPKHPAERLPCVFCRFAEQDRKDREREAKLRNAALSKAERKR